MKSLPVLFVRTFLLAAFVATVALIGEAFVVFAMRLLVHPVLFTSFWALGLFSGMMGFIPTQLSPSRIGSGHAFAEHTREFGNIGQTQFEEIVRNALGNPYARIRDLPRGRTAFYDIPTNVLVIVSPRDPDSGTMFRPVRGQDYFDELD